MVPASHIRKPSTAAEMTRAPSGLTTTSHTAPQCRPRCSPSTATTSLGSHGRRSSAGIWLRSSLSNGDGALLITAAAARHSGEPPCSSRICCHNFHKASTSTFGAAASFFSLASSCRAASTWCGGRLSGTSGTGAAASRAAAGSSKPTGGRRQAKRDMTDPFPGCGSQNGLTGSITPLTGPGKPRARAANGVQGVTLSVNTVAGGTVVNGTTLSGPTVGAGSVGTIDLPPASVLSINARGDLGNFFVPSSSSSLTGATDIDLYLANLTGTIPGLDHD